MFNECLAQHTPAVSLAGIEGGGTILSPLHLTTVRSNSPSEIGAIFGRSDGAARFFSLLKQSIYFLPKFVPSTTFYGVAGA